MKKIGLIVNPIAGIGGPAGLKGSDGEKIQELALSKGAVKESGKKAEAALAQITSCKEDISLFCGPGEMGEAVANRLGLECQVMTAIHADTTAADTEFVAAQMKECGIDLIAFAGGDGTARNIRNAVGDEIPVIGIPAGVKIHSGVFATSPTAAGRLIETFAKTETMKFHLAEVIDLNEDAYRQGRIGDTLYGYMKVPVIGYGMQNPKAASHNSEDDVGGICQEIREKMVQEDPNTVYILCAGSTVYSLKQALGIEGTLLGIDVLQGGELIGKDVSANELREIVRDNRCRLILTAIGGQGHIFGRGNQQLAPDIIRRIGTDHIWIIAVASKIYGLPQQTLFVDTGDASLDEELRGYRRVIVGWQETLICRVM